MRLKALLLALLLVAPTASRVRASGPEPEAKPEKKQKKEKKVVVESPQQKIVIDDDGVFVDGEDGPELFADLGDFENMHGLSWFDGGGYIGVRPVEMTPELRTHFGAPKDAGVFVGTVEADSPAAKAGLQVGDIVTSADGQKVEGRRDLVRTIRRKKDGDTVQLDVVRDRAAKKFTVTVAEREDARVRLGELGPQMKRFHMRHPVPPVPPVPPVAPAPPVPSDIQDQLDDLQKRLDALESRIPTKQN